MGVVLARIDNRLIHGQVLEAWVPYTHADCIIVANDKVASDPLRRTMMAASVPRGIQVVIGGIAELSEQLLQGKYAGNKVLLLFETSADALDAHRRGFPYQSLNLGNMHAGAGKMRCSCTISLDPDDIANLESLEAQEGVRIVSQCIPADRERPWRKLID
jgi:PTS system mannose-specific IIB component